MNSPLSDSRQQHLNQRYPPPSYNPHTHNVCSPNKQTHIQIQSHLYIYVYNLSLSIIWYLSLSLYVYVCMYIYIYILLYMSSFQRKRSPRSTILSTFLKATHSCHILPFQPILWNNYFPPEPAKTAKHSPKSISEGGRIWQVCNPQTSMFLSNPRPYWDVWMYGCMDAWMYGCMDVWMYGCMDVWMYRCMIDNHLK